MKKSYSIVAGVILSLSIINAQGPNRTFGLFKKAKNSTELSCSENCATLVLIYEKGTFINSVKAAVGIDDTYAVAADKGCYIEMKIPAGEHKISLPQGVNDGDNIQKVIECEPTDTSFVALCSMFSDWENYSIQLRNDIFDLKYNLTGVPYTNKIFAYQVNYLTYTRNFKPGQTYYYKTIKLAKGLSLSCGPLVTETSRSDFESIIQGKTIKEKGEPIVYINPEKE
jgi:hypothetical protein